MNSIIQKIRSLRNVFARQGSIVESWRYRNGRKIGPYFRLAYRAAGRQHSIYLGKSQNILRQVRRLLEKLQKPINTKHILRNAQKTFQEAMKKHQAQFRIDLLQVGLQLRGYAVRGWRRWRARLRSQCTPHAPCEGDRLPISSLPIPLFSNPPPSNDKPEPVKLPVCHPC